MNAYIFSRSAAVGAFKHVGLSALLTVLVTLLLGLLVGAWFGGNYAENFQFNGVRGYEATGQIGLLCGVFVLLLLGAYYWAKGKNDRSNSDGDK